MLSCSSRREASYRQLQEVYSQLAHVPVLSSVLLQSANMLGLHVAAVPRREGKALVLAPITQLGDGLAQVSSLKIKSFRKVWVAFCRPSLHGL